MFLTELPSFHSIEKDIKDFTFAIERQEPAIVVQNCNVYYSEDFLKKKGILSK